MPSIWHETPSLPKSNSNHVICHHPKTAPTVRKIYHHHDKKNPNTAPILLENNNNNNNNSDQSDYGELRAIVQRIERNRNESKQVVGVSANASGGGGSHNNNNRFQQQQANKKLVFDYVPASVMMKK